MVRSASHGSGDTQWHIFAFGQVDSRRKDPLKPLISVFGHVHSRVREMMRAHEYIDPEFVFDEVLTLYNDQWKTLFPQSDVKHLLQSSYVIGIVKGGRLCLADRGMCVGKMITRIDGRNTVIPVLTARTGESTSSSLFESIVCGALPDQSRIVLGTSQLRHVGRNDVFVQLLSKRTTTFEIIWHRMQKKLKLAGDPAVAGIMLGTYTNTSSQTSPEGVSQGFSEYMQSPPASHTAFFDRISKQLLVLVRRIGMALHFLFSRLRIALRALRKRTPSWLHIPTPITAFFVGIGRGYAYVSEAMMQNPTTATITRSGRTFITGLFRGFLLSLLWLGTHILRPLKRLGRWLRASFMRLHVVQKVALIGVGAALIGITVGVYATRVTKQNALIAAQQEELQDRFLQQFHIAESKLVFGNIPEAKSALSQAEQILHELRSAEVDVAPLQQQLLAVRNELLKEDHVSLSIVAYQSQDKPVVSVRRIDDRMIALHNDRFVNILNSRETVLPHPLGVGGVVAAADDGILFIEDSTVTSYTGSHNALSVGDMNISGLSGIQAAQRYADRLYTLDASGHIFRHGESAGGYSKGSTWSEQPISAPIDMTIDGHIYVLSSRGDIKKYFKGNPIPYDFSSIDPPLQSPQLIWTHPTIDHVYVLEPASRRLVVLNKTGLMLIQYIFDKPVESFAIDESARKGYVSVGSQVYVFDLRHLKI